MSEKIMPQEDAPVDLVEGEKAPDPALRVFCEACRKSLSVVKNCKQCKTLKGGNKAGQEELPNDVDPSFEPESIIEVTESNGELTFVMKRKDSDEVYLIPSKIANVKYSQLVLKFYEQRLEWLSASDDEDEMDQLNKSG